MAEPDRVTTLIARWPQTAGLGEWTPWFDQISQLAVECGVHLTHVGVRSHDWTTCKGVAIRAVKGKLSRALQGDLTELTLYGARQGFRTLMFDSPVVAARTVLKRYLCVMTWGRPDLSPLIALARRFAPRGADVEVFTSARDNGDRYSYLFFPDEEKPGTARWLLRRQPLSAVKRSNDD